MSVEDLITEHLDIWTSAIKTKSSAGRGSSKKLELVGIKKLRELILELAVRGKLVPQDPNDEPASELLIQIEAEKARLVKEGVIRKAKKLPEISNEEKFTSLPNSWRFVRLNELGDWGAGATPPRSDSSLYGGTIPWFKSGELNSDYISESEETVTELALKKSSLRLNKVGDVLVAMYGATIGKTSILSVQATSNQAVCACTPFNGFSNLFLLTLLKAYRQRFIAMGAGGAQPNISREKIINTVIALPPLNEQHRIVAKVDELMALCDQLEAQTENSIQAHQLLVETLLATLSNAKDADELSESWQRISQYFDVLFTTQDSIDQLKQTILQLAVMGKLVKQDTNDEPAAKLLKRIAAEKDLLIKSGKMKKQKPLAPIKDEEKQFRLPSGWEWVTFDLIAKNEKNALKAGPFGSALKKSFYVEDGYKIYGQEQVISGDENLGDYYINEDKYKSLESCSVKPGDMLISLVGTIGKVLVISNNAKPGIINPRLVKLSLQENVNRDYIRIVLGSRLIQDVLLDKSHGSTMNVLNLGLLRQLTFPMPRVEEQIRIVGKVDELMNLCDSLQLSLKQAQNTQLKVTYALVEQSL